MSLEYLADPSRAALTAPLRNTDRIATWGESAGAQLAFGSPDAAARALARTVDFPRRQLREAR